MRDEHDFKIALLNNCFLDRPDTVSSIDLLGWYVYQYKDSEEFYKPKWKENEKKLNARRDLCKKWLRELVDEEYITMKENEYGEWFTTATQKLYDANLFPVGFTTRELQEPTDINNIKKQ